jgi:hypothetical protein
MGISTNPLNPQLPLSELQDQIKCVNPRCIFINRGLTTDRIVQAVKIGLGLGIPIFEVGSILPIQSQTSKPALKSPPSYPTNSLMKRDGTNPVKSTASSTTVSEEFKLFITDPEIQIIQVGNNTSLTQVMVQTGEILKSKSMVVDGSDEALFLFTSGVARKPKGKLIRSAFLHRCEI